MYENNFRKAPDGAVGEGLFIKIDKSKKNQGYTRLKSNDTCNCCKKMGYWVNTSKKWVADGRPSRPKDAPQSNILDTNVALCDISGDILETSTSVWWIANGAKYVANCPEQCFEFQEFRSPSVIKTAGKEALKSIGKGTIEIPSFTEDCTRMYGIFQKYLRIKNNKFYSTSSKCWLEVNGKMALS